MYLNKHCHRHSRFKMKPAPAEVSVELKKVLCSALKVSCTDLTSRTFGGLLEVAGVDLSYQDEQCGATPALGSLEWADRVCEAMGAYSNESCRGGGGKDKVF